MRVHITGNAGSGKSTFARSIGKTLGIDIYGLDKIVWSDGWRKTPLNERKRLEKELVSKPQWIIEGVSSIVRQAADVIIFLDFPRSVCYFRCAKRNWRYLFTSRPNLPDNCPEIKIVPTLVKTIWCFPSVAKPVIINDINTRKKASVIISSNKEITSLLNELKSSVNCKSQHIKKLTRTYFSLVLFVQDRTKRTKDKYAGYFNVR